MGRTLNNFDYLVKVCQSVHILKNMTKENPLKAHCDCYFGMKKKICRQLIGVAIQLGYLKPPAQQKLKQLLLFNERLKSGINIK